MSVITTLPDAPSRATPSTFASKADAFIAALPTFVTEMNNIISTIFGRLSGTKTLVNDTTTNLFEVSTDPPNDIASGVLHYSIEVGDVVGNRQVHAGIFTFAGMSGFSASKVDGDEVKLTDTDTTVCSSGTLTDVWTVTLGANVLRVNLKATSSLTPTSMSVKYTVFLNGNNDITAS